MPKDLLLSENSCIEIVEDVGKVVDTSIADNDSDSGHEEVVQGEIVGVLSCDEYKSCIKCNGKVMELGAVIGECSKCGLTTKLNRCDNHKSVRMIIEDESGVEHKVVACDDIVNKIVDNVPGNNTKEKLLCAPPMTFTITKKGVICSIS